MRDLIWTLIVVWLVWKIWSLFKGERNIYIQKNERHFHYSGTENNQSHTDPSSPKKEKVIRDSEGEYVDFEEFKK
jgi:hypothetical protein